MNKKILYTTFLSLSPFIAFGQQNKIGINKDTDIQETVDVGGDMRISNIGSPNNKAIPLGVNQNNKVYKIYESSDDQAPMKSISYKINLKESGSDWAEYINLNINATKYLAILTQASLVRSDFNTSNNLSAGAYPRISLRNYNGSGTGVNAVRVVNGYIKDQNGGEILNNNSNNVGPESNFKYLAAPIQEAFLSKENNTYYFYGDYKDGNLTGTDKYSWVINVLLINRNWIKTNQ